jgi:hypothetical protein
MLAGWCGAVEAPPGLTPADQSDYQSYTGKVIRSRRIEEVRYSRGDRRLTSPVWGPKRPINLPQKSFKPHRDTSGSRGIAG